MYSFHFLVFFCVLLKLLFCSGRFYSSACTCNFHTSSVVSVYPSHLHFLSLIIWKCQIAKQNLATGRETRISKKARRDKGAMDFFQSRFATWNPLVFDVTMTTGTEWVGTRLISLIDSGYKLILKLGFKSGGKFWSMATSCSEHACPTRVNEGTGLSFTD